MPFTKWKLQENDINYVILLLLAIYAGRLYQQDGHNVIDIIFLLL